MADMFNVDTPILGETYVARSVNAANSRLVNLFPEVVPQEGKSAGFFSRAPGLTLLGTLGSGPIRGMWAYAGAAFVVSGNGLYRVDISYKSTYIGAVSGNGPVSMSDNGVQLFVAANGPSYIYDAVTTQFQQITDPDFPGAVTVGYIDGYFVFNEPNSQRIWVSAILDGTNIDPLAFASAEGSPDGLVALAIDHREIWLFGTSTVEVWYNAGQADFPLERIQGAFNELGCAAPYSVTKVDNSLFWLGSDARGGAMVYRADGYNGARMSTHAIEWQIQRYSYIADAVGYAYQQDGHLFYVLNFPTANATWVYDVATKAWHERASFSNGSFGRHFGNCHVFFNSTNIVGDCYNGNIYKLDLNNYSDNGATQKWVRSWRAIGPNKNDLNRTAQHSLQIDIEAGVGLNTYGAQDTNVLLMTENGNRIILTQNTNNLSTPAYPAPAGYDPEVTLRFSDDGGHTWSSERTAKIGKVGEYARRVIFRRLGMTTKLRDRVYEISGTDPVKISIMGAMLEASGTNG